MRIWNTLITLMIAFLLDGDLLKADVAVLRFQGQLVQPQASGQQVNLREFQCVLVDSPSGSFFFVLDRPEGCPWPDSYGTAVNSASGGVSPHLIYRFDGNAYTISLPDFKIDLPSDLDRESTWSVGDWKWRVKDPPKSDPSHVKLKATERRGRQQEATFDQTTGWLVEAELDVFMGRGEKFQLRLKRTSVDKLPDELWNRQQSAQEALLQLQTQMNRRADSQRTDLSERQIQLAKATLNQLSDVPEDLPVRPLLDRISKQVASQAKSIMVAESAKAGILGKTLEAFSLTQLNGRPLTAKQFTGKPLVLHFWSYSQNAMEEPYGQVAYLEFLKSRLAERNVNVIGVVTNPLIRSAERQATELRSARKVAEFMNLSYPIAYDDGALQNQCDPAAAVRDSFPLWIVVDSTGTVVYYHQGFYEVDRRAGLKELAAAVEEVIIESN